MRMPSRTALDVVEKFSWTSNVVRNGRLISQEYVVAEAIDRALATERERCAQIAEGLNGWGSARSPRKRAAELADHIARVIRGNDEQTGEEKR